MREKRQLEAVGELGISWHLAPHRVHGHCRTFPSSVGYVECGGSSDDDDDGLGERLAQRTTHCGLLIFPSGRVHVLGACENTPVCAVTSWLILRYSMLLCFDCLVSVSCTYVSPCLPWKFVRSIRLVSHVAMAARCGMEQPNVLLALNETNREVVHLRDIANSLEARVARLCELVAPPRIPPP